MKKLALLIIPLLILTLVLGACAKQAAPTTTAAPAPSTTTTAAPGATTTAAPKPSVTTTAATPAQPAQVIEWKAQHGNPSGTILMESLKREMARVGELSGGRFIIKTYGGGELFPANKEHDAIDNNLLDRTNATTIWWKDRWVVAPLFNYTVGGLRPIEMMLWMMRGGNDLLQELIKDTNRVVFPGWTGTPEIFLSTTKELKSLEDIKGLKIRTGGDDGVLLTKMGAAVVQVPPGEVYESMKRGVIDAFQLGAPAVDQSYKVYEVCKNIYISDVRQPSEYFTPCVNKQSWAKLPDDLKGIMQAASLEECWRYLAQATEGDAKAIEFYKQYGVNIAPAPKDITDEMLKQAKIYYDAEAAKDPFYAKVLQSQRDFIAAHRSLYPAGL